MNCRLLYNEEPIVINRLSAKVLGLNESIVVQQIHYWLNINKKAKKNFYDGRYWSYNTYKKWHEENFDFWSEKTVKRIFKNLYDNGILIKGNYNKRKGDNTLWVSLDYDRLNEILGDFESEGTSCPSVEIPTVPENENLGHIEISTKGQIDPDQKDNLSLALPETTTRDYVCMYVDVAIQQFFSKSRKPSKVQIDKINKIKDKVTYDLFVRILEVAKEKNKTLNYALGTCKKLIEQNINTIEQYEIHMENFSKSFEQNKTVYKGSPRNKNKFANFDETFDKYDENEFDAIIVKQQVKHDIRKEQSKKAEDELREKAIKQLQAEYVATVNPNDNYWKAMILRKMEQIKKAGN